MFPFRLSLALLMLMASGIARAASGIPSSAATVPIHVDHGVVLFEARVNGQGPFTFVLDPGAGDTIASDVLRKLRMHSDAEIVQLDLAVGDMQVGTLPVQVLPGAGEQLYPQHDTAGPPIAGALGPGILDRVALRLDYGAATMTLISLETFKYRGSGSAVPIVFHDVIPLLGASVDGITGLFAYDVRAPGTMLLFHPFLERNGLLDRYGVHPDAAHSMLPVTLHALEVAGITLYNQPARFGGFTEGKFAAQDEAGLLGYKFLSQFVTTIDYRHKLIYFETSTARSQGP